MRKPRRYFSHSPTPVCDFCLGPDVDWEYRTNMFVFPADDEFPMYVDSGDWAACDACMRDIEAVQYPPIGARLFVNMVAQLEPGEHIDMGSERWAARLFAAFLANKLGPPVPESDRPARRPRSRL